jgi:4-amino-4-deoxy-L-arabinose transferase
VRLFGLLLFAGAVLLVDLGSMGALESTDARYLEIAREMRATGDVLVPRLAGVPHLDKPPLAYWAACAGFALFGVGELGGRFFEQMALLATAAVLCAWARRRMSPRAAVGAGLALVATPVVFGASRGLATDLFQLLFLTPALLLLYEGTRGRGSSLGVALAGALLGASMLAKGPIALLLAAAVLAPYLVLTRGRTRLPLAGVALGLLLFAALGLPWYVGRIADDPARLRFFVLEQLFGRVTGGAGHPHGPVYLVARWPLLLLPWTPVVALVLGRGLRRAWRGEADSFELFVLLWALVPVAVFSLPATKLLSYLLPAAPATALLVARAGDRGELSDAWGRRAVRGSAGLLALAALGAAGALAARSRLGEAPFARIARERLASPDAVAVLLALLGVAAALAALRRARVRALGGGVIGLGAGTAALFALGFHAVAPALPTLREPARLVRDVSEARLVQHGTFDAGMLFYTGRTWQSYVAATSHFCSSPPETDRVADLCLRRSQSVALLLEPAPTFALVTRSHAEALAQATGAWPVYSSRELVLLANAAARERLAASGGAAERAP